MSSPPSSSQTAATTSHWNKDSYYHPKIHYVTEGLKSNQSARQYLYQFNAFLKYLGLRPNDDNDLLQLLRKEPEEIEELISGHELDEDFRRAGNRLRDILILDFDREMALAEVFVDRNDLIEAAYHRAMAYAIHNTLRDLEMVIR